MTDRETWFRLPVQNKADFFPKLEIAPGNPGFTYGSTLIPNALRTTLTPRTTFSTKMIKFTTDNMRHTNQDNAGTVIDIEGIFNNAYFASGNADKGLQDVCVNFSITKIGSKTVTPQDGDAFYFKTGFLDGDNILNSRRNRALYSDTSKDIKIQGLVIHRNVSFSGIEIDANFLSNMKVIQSEPFTPEPQQIQQQVTLPFQAQSQQQVTLPFQAQPQQQQQQQQPLPPLQQQQQPLPPQQQQQQQQPLPPPQRGGKKSNKKTHNKKKISKKKSRKTKNRKYKRRILR